MPKLPDFLAQAQKVTYASRNQCVELRKPIIVSSKIVDYIAREVSVCLIKVGHTPSGRSTRKG